MKTAKLTNKTWIAGILTATAASLCCITPVLALISGASGIASSFSWMEPYRPYLIGLTIAVLGLAWYQKLKPKKIAIDCACEEDQPSFWQSKALLGIVTALAILLVAFPSYSKIFFHKPEAGQIIVVDKNSMQQVRFHIANMDCEACSQTINLALSKVNGVLEYNTQFKTGSSIVKFDTSKTSEETIKKTINATGYTVSGATPVH
jgi:copper chaperone CopZ